MVQEKPKTSKVKWIAIIIIILLLAFFSMIISGILGLIFAISSINSQEPIEYGEGNVALIPIKGIILTEKTSDFFDRSLDTSSSEVLETLKRIKNDNSIKAVIFEINSPGGSGVAADEIASAIKSLNKTTVAYVREVGASAAYWIASSTDHIIANRFSTVGSIGVIGSFIEFSGLMDDHNVSYQRFVGGKYKDFGSPFRQPSKEAAQLYQELIDSLHIVFIEEIAANRNMEIDDVKKLAHGFIFTGMQGIDNGLIDQIGGKTEAIKFVEQQENITADIVEFVRPTSIFDMLGFMSSESSYKIGKGIGDSLKVEQEQKVMFR